MDIEKSKRHSKIIGDFGEGVLLNWLSRSGFEVCRVDHTGLDIIAYHPKTDKRLGISVKSRTRNGGKEDTHVNVLSCRKRKNDRQKLLDACDSFSCEPYLAVYVETVDSADLYLTSLAHYDEKYKARGGRAIDDWKMGDRYIEKYDKDPDVKHIHMAFNGKPVNRNHQVLIQKTKKSGTDHNRKIWILCCANPQKPECAHVYGANGSDFHQRKCPKCQDGAPGLSFD
jgi:Holliday junction resolvase